MVIGAVTISRFYLVHRTTRSVQDTLQKALEQGHTLTPERPEQLSTTVTPTESSDTRKGILLIALGIAFAAVGLISERYVRL